MENTKYTKQQRLQVYDKLKVLINRERHMFFFCNEIGSVLEDLKIEPMYCQANPEDFPELYKRKPKKAYGISKWWRGDDIESRKICLDEMIKELKSIM